mgnify:CR=1 FL=1
MTYMNCTDATAYMGQLADLFARAVSETLTTEVLRGVGVEGMTPSLLAALECLHRRGVGGVGDLARDLGVTYAAASQFAARLEQKGLLVRQHDARDRRRAALRLSTRGAQVVDQVARLRADRLQAILARMPEEQRQALLDALEAFLFHAFEDAAAIERLCGRCRIPHSPQCVVNQMALARTGRGVKRPCCTPRSDAPEGGGTVPNA